MLLTLIRKIKNSAGEMAQWIRALAASPQDLGSIPLIWWLTIAYDFSSREAYALLQPLWQKARKWHTDMKPEWPHMKRLKRNTKKIKNICRNIY